VKIKDRLNWLFLGSVAGFLVGAVAAVVTTFLFFDFMEKSTKKTFMRTPPRTAEGSMRAALLKKMFISFEEPQELSFFRPADNITYELSAEHATHGAYSLMTKMPVGEGYPGLEWESLDGEIQDWRPYKEFHFDAYNPTDYFVQCEVKFKSGNAGLKKSFSVNVKLEPYKMNHVVIPLAQVAQYCDLAQISFVKIFPIEPKVDLVLYFDNIGVD